ncbi:MAG TPA: prepilin-type N-terminal cleavage/methylation domain-containing protein [Terriglobales bacterium]|nr:prepilin-type N-terminal cleavage/methylation domain-containing protein [Terriglobales bacterium]
MKKSEFRKRSGGFSLVELLIVVVVMLVVAAIAAPNIMQAVANFRLRSAATAQAQMVQRVRMKALSNNRIEKLGFTWNWIGGSSYYVSTFVEEHPANWTVDANERDLVAQMPLGMWMGWGPDTTTMQLDFVPQNEWWRMGFDGQGNPCVWDFNGGCSVAFGGQQRVGFVYYLYQTNTWNPTGYAAVTISPSGRVRTWIWSGNRWQ